MASLLLATILLAATPTSSQTTPQMTPQQQQDTGLNKLTPDERAALQKWIQDNHYPKSNNQRPSGMSISDPSAENAPTLSLNLRAGQFIQLSDDSLWQIHPSDQTTAQGWVSPVPIYIQPSNDPNFPTLLINSLTGSKLRAKQIDALPPAPASPANIPIAK